jgi:hypothetical protein
MNCLVGATFITICLLKGLMMFLWPFLNPPASTMTNAFQISFVSVSQLCPVALSHLIYELLASRYGEMFAFSGI